MYVLGSVDSCSARLTRTHVQGQTLLLATCPQRKSATKYCTGYECCCGANKCNLALLTYKHCTSHDLWQRMQHMSVTVCCVMSACHCSTGILHNNKLAFPIYWQLAFPIQLATGIPILLATGIPILLATSNWHSQSTMHLATGLPILPVNTTGIPLQLSTGMAIQLCTGIPKLPCHGNRIPRLPCHTSHRNSPTTWQQQQTRQLRPCTWAVARGQTA
jgi:hypothetical protein